MSRIIPILLFFPCISQVTFVQLSDNLKAAISDASGEEQARASGLHRDVADELIEVKADKQPIGQYAEEKPFTTHSLKLNEGDIIYVFSDGFPDQFGGEDGKKYKSGKFKRTLTQLASQPIEKQHDLLEKEFINWQRNQEQVDDLCIIGVRV